MLNEHKSCDKIDDCRHRRRVVWGRQHRDETWRVWCQGKWGRSIWGHLSMSARRYEHGGKGWKLKTDQWGGKYKLRESRKSGSKRSLGQDRETLKCHLKVFGYYSEEEWAMTRWPPNLGCIRLSIFGVQMTGVSYFQGVLGGRQFFQIIGKEEIGDILLCKNISSHSLPSISLSTF